MDKVRILDLVWNDTNITHIWERHRITRAEVEEVAYGQPHLLKAEESYAGRLLVTGPKADGTLLVLIVARNITNYCIGSALTLTYAC